jgi:hypothetical protein
VPTNSLVELCARCGAPIDPSRVKCAACGALNVARPVPAAAITHAATAAPDAPALPTPPSDQFFAPAVLQNPVVVHPPARAPRDKSSKAPIVAIALALLAVGGIAYPIIASGGHGKPKTPVPMAPHGANTGLPSGLADVVRIQAESARQTAFAAISQAYGDNNGQQLTPSALQNNAPSLTWFSGDNSSKGPTQVSYQQTADGVTIAIAASSKEVCAYGKWSPGQVSQYVTMLNDTTCRADQPPASGWSTLAGGANTDLPPDGY